MWKWIKRLLWTLLSLALLAVMVVIVLLRTSLPDLNGEIQLSGLQQPVSVMRDSLGVPTIAAENRADVYRAQGFVHAQERYFIMDLTRRDAAGELSELFGEVALQHDVARRLHRFRARATLALQAADPAQRALLDAYVDGVNAGLNALGGRPPEYYLLGHQPRPWSAEDSVLVVYAMYFDLQDEGADRDANLGLLHAALPPALAQFLSSPGTAFDAPIDGREVLLPRLPDVDQLGQFAPSSASPAPALEGERSDPDEINPGSNNWAVAGTHSADGGAWLANDMHLGLRNPNIWFRTRLQYSEPGVGEVDVTGVTLPGVPGVVAGSNGKVAWGFTNSYGDYSDRIVLETDPERPGQYRTAQGWRAFDEHPQQIRIGSEQTHDIVVRETIWGPVLNAADGQLHALRWVAHAPDANNLVLTEMAHVQDLDAAQALANQVGGPAQNFVAADHQGRVGWTLMGPLPQRVYPATRLPVPWQAAGDGSWSWLPPNEYPRVVDPQDGLIWTANARVVGGTALELIGDGGYAGGFRARQIRDGLRARDGVSGADHLAIQLDDRALFLDRWQRLLMATLQGSRSDPSRQALKQVVDQWGARASVDSVGYLAVRHFRLLMMDWLMSHLTAPVKDRYEDFQWQWLNQIEHPLWTLVSAQPEHLLPEGYRSWHELLLAAADRTHAELVETYGSLEQATWGARNQVVIRHPMSRGVPPWLAKYLDLPAQTLPGDSHMPRVQAPGFGASQRLAVSPGREPEGYFHMPAGQSGHPLSPFYGAGNDAWAQGEASSFLPGPSAYQLDLVP